MVDGWRSKEPPPNPGFLLLHVSGASCLDKCELMRVWIHDLPRKIREVNATCSFPPRANTREMSLSKFFNAQIALVELPRGPTLEGCGCTWQRPGVNVCNSVRVKSGVDERECVLCKYPLDKLRRKLKVPIESYKEGM